MVATSKLPVTDTSYLSQAPANVIPAPIMIFIDLIFVITYCNPKSIFVEHPNDDEISRNECYQK